MTGRKEASTPKPWSPATAHPHRCSPGRKRPDGGSPVVNTGLGKKPSGGTGTQAETEIGYCLGRWSGRRRRKPIRNGRGSVHGEDVQKQEARKASLSQRHDGAGSRQKRHELQVRREERAFHGQRLGGVRRKSRQGNEVCPAPGDT